MAGTCASPYSCGGGAAALANASGSSLNLPDTVCWCPVPLYACRLPLSSTDYTL